jgi:GNAT superfamily N-acetyltransferase
MTTPRADTSQCDVVLRDGSTLLIREARAEDEPDLRRFYDELSRESAYFRFLAVRKHHETEIARIRNADPVNDLVLVGEADGHVLAVASYARNRQAPHRADVAFAIADALQGRGVGTRLLERLAEIARQHGITFFDADVLG